MDHASEGITAPEGMLDCIGVPHIPFNHVDGVGSRQLLNPVECLWRAVVEVVQHHKLVALFQQNKAGVTANEAGTTCDEDSSAHVFHRLGVLILNQLDCKSLTPSAIEPMVRPLR